MEAQRPGRPLSPGGEGTPEAGLEAQAWGWAQNSCSRSLPQVSNCSRKSWAPELLLVAHLLSPPSVFHFLTCEVGLTIHPPSPDSHTGKDACLLGGGATEQC